MNPPRNFYEAQVFHSISFILHEHVKLYLSCMQVLKWSLRKINIIIARKDYAWLDSGQAEK